MTMTGTTLDFPSVAWFEALAEASARDEERYRRLGFVDIALGVRVGEQAFCLAFEDFGCASVSEWDAKRPVACVVSASLEDWQELVRHIQAHGHADPRHTLNSLVLAGDRFELTGEEQLDIDAFYRFNATIQAFFDECASVPTSFG